MADGLSALLIDDDDLVLATLSRQLERHGVTVTASAGDALDARIALARGPAVDLIVLDLLLDGVDAVELLRELPACRAGTALILISSQESQILRSVAVLAAEQGLNVLGALRKPIRVEALGALLRPLTAAPAPAPRPTPIAVARISREVLAQPKVGAADGRPHSIELLAPPPEAGGEDALLALACRTGAHWWHAGHHLPVALSLGAETLRRLDLPDRLDRLLASVSLLPQMLILQAGESVLLDDARTLDVLTRLRLRGIRVSLDQFGSGLGSLVRLQRLPLSEVRIAPGFVRCLPGSGPAAAIVEHVLRLGTALALETVAVGVEREDQAETLRSMGCAVLQGPAIAGPMALDAIPDWLRARAATPAVVPAEPVDATLEAAA